MPENYYDVVIEKHQFNRVLTIREAFDQAVALADHYKLHCGYAGTIAGKKNFTIITGKTPINIEDDFLAEWRMSYNKKYGNDKYIDGFGFERQNKFYFFGTPNKDEC